MLGAEVEVRALRGVDLPFIPDSYVAIMGPSGSGKSTMLNILGCLDRPTGGSYFLGGTDVSRMPDDDAFEARGQRIGFIFQSYNLIAQLTVIENIQVPLLYQGKDLRDFHDHCVKLARDWWGWATACIIVPTSCPAASSSAWPSRVRWSTTR